MCKSGSLQMLGLKLVKPDCIIIHLDLDTIKKARNELDGASGLPFVFSKTVLHITLIHLTFAPGKLLT